MAINIPDRLQLLLATALQIAIATMVFVLITHDRCFCRCHYSRADFCARITGTSTKGLCAS